METIDLTTIETLLARQNVLLEALLVVACFLLGSVLFVHFGRFMRW